MPYYTPIVTLLAVAFNFFLATRVAVARGKFGVGLPATTGNPVFRAHLPRSSEHARMDADFLGAAVALCGLSE